MEETISLKEMFNILRKRLLLITLLIIGAAGISGAVSYFVLTPTYESSSQLIVSQKSQVNGQDIYNVDQIRSSVELINTYHVVIKSPAVLEQVAQDLNLSLSVGQLDKKLTVVSEEKSQVMTITATDTNPELAAAIANKTVEIFQEKVPTLMNVNNISVLSEAEAPAVNEQISPKPVLNIIVALVLGGVIGMGVAFLLEYLDNTFKTETELEDKLGLPVLGVVSHVSEKEIKSAALKVVKPTKLEGEEYKNAEKKTI